MSSTSPGHFGDPTPNGICGYAEDRNSELCAGPAVYEFEFTDDSGWGLACTEHVLTLRTMPNVKRVRSL